MHPTDAVEISLDLAHLAAELRFHLLGVAFEVVICFDGFELFEALEPGANGREVGQGAAEPALGDIVHFNIANALFDDALCLALGSDEANIFAAGDGFGEELASEQQPLHSLFDIDDVDAVAFAINVWRHLRVPAA